MACSVAQRTRELGIRTALGATGRAVLRMVIRQGMTVAAIGLAVVVPARRATRAEPVRTLRQE